MPTRLRRLRSTVCLLALLGGGVYGGAHLALSAAAHKAVLEATGPGATVARISVEPLSGRISVHGLQAARDGGPRISIGAATFQGPGLVAPAHAAQTFSVEGIKVEVAGASYTIPRIEVVGGTMAPEDLRAIFDTSPTTPLSVRMAKISAEQIIIPEIVGIATGGDVSSRFVYRDTRLFNVAAGVVRSLAISGGTFESTTKDQPASKGEFGPMAATAIDLPWIAKSYMEAAGPDDSAPRVAYATFGIDGITATSTTPGGVPIGKVEVGRIVGRDVRTRPSKEPWLPVVQSLAARSEAEMKELPAAERSRLVRAITDMLEGSDVGLVEATDLRFSDPAGKDGAVRFGRLSYSGAAVGRPSEFRIETIEVGDKETQARVGSIIHTGFSFTSTLQGLRETLGDPDFDPADIDVRKLIPELGTFSIRDVEIRTSAPKGGQPTRMGLKAVEIAATEPLAGIPTSLRLALDRLTLDLPTTTSEDGLKDLIALGYKEVDLSMGLEARWREADNDLSISNVSVQGVNMGSVVLRGTVGNVTRDVFEGDATMAQIALFGATVKQVALTIDNRGLFERVLEREARRQKKTPDQLRKELGGAAQMLIPALLGGTASAKSVAAAVSKFIAKPNRLVVTAKSRNPMGVGAADVLMNAGSPADILAQIDLAATAE